MQINCFQLFLEGNSHNLFKPVFVNCVVYHKLHMVAAKAKLLGIYQSLSCLVFDAQTWVESVTVWLTTNQITFRDRVKLQKIWLDTIGLIIKQEILGLAVQNRLRHWHFQNLFSKFVAFMEHQLLCLPCLTSYQWAATLDACQKGAGNLKIPLSLNLANHSHKNNQIRLFYGHAYVLIRYEEIENVSCYLSNLPGENTHRTYCNDVGDYLLCCMMFHSSWFPTAQCVCVGLLYVCTVSVWPVWADEQD